MAAADSENIKLFVGLNRLDDSSDSSDSSDTDEGDTSKHFINLVVSFPAGAHQKIRDNNYLQLTSLLKFYIKTRLSSYCFANRVFENGPVGPSKCPHVVITGFDDQKPIYHVNRARTPNVH